MTVDIGPYSVIVVRDDDEQVSALHNVCRHRGSRVLTEPSGSVGNIVCGYHQWTYGTDGAPAARGLARARLRPGLLRTQAGARPDGRRARLRVPRAGPARRLRRRGRPDRAVPGAPPAATGPRWPRRRTWSRRATGSWSWRTTGSATTARPATPSSRARSSPPTATSWTRSPTACSPRTRATCQAEAELERACHERGLPYAAIEEISGRPTAFRIQREPLDGAGESYTIDGSAASRRLLGDLDTPRLGRLSLHHQPNAWFHFCADHAVAFSVLPLAPDRTLVRTTWLVHEDAVEGVDYDLDRLTEVWRRTNEQDSTFVARAHAGRRRPGVPARAVRPQRVPGRCLRRLVRRAS